MLWQRSLLFLLMVSVCCRTSGQGFQFFAEATPTRIGIRDAVQVTFTIRNADNLKNISPVSFGEFDLLQGPFQEQSMSITNGARSVSFSLTYILRPKREGKLIIPPAVAHDAAGHEYRSNQLAIDVVPGTVAQAQQQRRPQNGMFDEEEDPFALMRQQMQQMQQLQRQLFDQQRQGGQPQRQQQQPQQHQQEEPAVNMNEINKDLFIKVVVDKTDVRVGEQITTSYKLYSRLPMQVNISKLPSLNGFWTQDFEIPRQAKPTEEIVNGKKYQVFLLKKSALFPQSAGTLQLDPAEAKGVARIVQQVKRRMSDMFADPFGIGTLMMNDPFFNNAFFNSVGYKDVDVHLKSSPVNITVRPLPEKDKPEGFGGAVGQFTVNSKIDKTDLTTDDVATLTFTVTGSGNLKLIESPTLKLPNGINTYDPQVVDTITGRSTTIAGSKIITYAITPQTPGDYDIPPISFTYFNPQTGAYVTTKTPGYKIHVKPGKHYNPGKIADENRAVALRDIHDISQKPVTSISGLGKPLFFTAGYWLLYLLPVFAFSGLVVYKRRNEEMLNNTTILRNKRANKIALQRLATAKRYLSENAQRPFYDEVSKAIWLYISDKSGIPLSSLSKEAADVALDRKRVPAPLKASFDAVIAECESALYASGGRKPMSQIFDDAFKVISELEGFM